jgi:hypothetical protein
MLKVIGARFVEVRIKPTYEAMSSLLQLLKIAVSNVGERIAFLRAKHELQK